MAITLFESVKKAIVDLDPKEVREQAEKPIRIGLHAANESAYLQMVRFFAPPHLSGKRRAEIANILGRATDSERYDLDIFSHELTTPSHGFTFLPLNPERTVREILQARPDLSLPLARHLVPFRKPVVNRIIGKVARENAVFSIATALPDIIPLVSLPWAIGEFASDTAFITANQIRMGFLLAGASDRPIGYREQRGEIATVMMGAFGWKALARELAGHIPFGGGILPKAAIAYAGTFLVGLSMERYYNVGYGLPRAERQAVYEQALQRGKTVANAIMAGMKRLPKGS